MAQSLKLSPFTSLGSPNGVLSDDFVHGSFETFKIKGSTSSGSKFDAKIKVNTSMKDGKVAANIVDESKLQFPILDRFTVQLGQRRKGEVRLHVDLGQVGLRGKQWNLFTNLKTDIGLSKYQFRLGTNYFGKNCESNTRLEVIPGESPVLTHRNYISKGSYYYGLVGSVSLAALSLTRYDALVGLTKGKYELNLKHESNTKKASLHLGTLTATAIYVHNASTKVATEVVNKCFKQAPTVTVGAQHKLANGQLVKAKLDSSLNLSLATKYAINKQLTITAATQLAFGANSLVDLKKFPPLPLGFQLDINV